MTAGIRRRRLLAWSALPVLLALCLAVKLLSVGVLGGQAASGFAAGDAGAVNSAAGGLGTANFIEPHKGPFASGDAAVLDGDYGTARIRFEQALGMAPEGSPDSCLIRVNLVLAIERLGDRRLQAGDPASAVLLFTEALAAADQAPQGCRSVDPDAGGRLAGARDRLERKLGAAEQPAGRPPAEEDSPPGEAGDERQNQLDQLQDSAREAERERNNGREREKYLDGGGGAAPERPW